mgnify:FL=1
MKMKYISIMTMFASVSLLSGCSDFLEKYPQDAMSDQDYFTKDTDLEYYMNGLYGGILRSANSYKWSNLNTANDDWAGNSPSGTLMQHSTSGLASETSDTWNNAYDYIRKVNYFLENAYRVPNMGKIGKHYLGEGYYCRAVKYFDLLQTFGGVPYISKVLNVDSEELYTPRSSRKEIAEKIVADLDSAILYCDWKGEGEASAGRINKEAALVMQSRVALYEGSWEFYHGKKGSKFQVQGSDGSVFLKKGIEAGEQLIEKYGSNIYRGSSGNEYFDYFNQSDYEKIQGAFLYKVYSRSLGIINNWGRSYAEGVNAGLTKSAIDAYVMSDGKPVEVSRVTLDNQTMNELCTKKDPRLSQTIWYPAKGRFFDYLGAVDHAYKTSYPGLIISQQRNPAYTGFRIWKGTSFDPEEIDNGEVDDLILRYEEGLLNYVEAKAILGLVTQDDLDKTINVIRSRVNMPSMSLSEVNGWSIDYDKRNGYDPSAPNVVNEIRRERRVELMLEGLRFMDIKRWAMLDDVFNGWKPVGAYAQEYVDYWNNPERLAEDGFDWKSPEEVKLEKGINYDTIGDYINPFFKHADFQPNSGRGYYVNPDRDYLSSIPREEITLYKNKGNVTLEQNPGWF